MKVFKMQTKTLEITVNFHNTISDLLKAVRFEMLNYSSKSVLLRLEDMFEGTEKYKAAAVVSKFCSSALDQELTLADFRDIYDCEICGPDWPVELDGILEFICNEFRNKPFNHRVFVEEMHAYRDSIDLKNSLTKENVDVRKSK
jgi:hypothetical protein